MGAAGCDGKAGEVQNVGYAAARSLPVVAAVCRSVDASVCDERVHPVIVLAIDADRQGDEIQQGKAAVLPVPGISHVVRPVKAASEDHAVQRCGIGAVGVRPGAGEIEYRGEERDTRGALLPVPPSVHRAVHACTVRCEDEVR